MPCVAVVALFNAIAKAKRETVAAEDAKAKKETTPAADDNGSIISRNSVTARGKATSVEGKGKGEKAAENGDAAGASGAKWAALRDDYMVGQKLTVKVSTIALQISFFMMTLLELIVLNFALFVTLPNLNSIGTKRSSRIAISFACWTVDVINLVCYFTMTRISISLIPVAVFLEFKYCRHDTRIRQEHLKKPGEVNSNGITVLDV